MNTSHTYSIKIYTKESKIEDIVWEVLDYQLCFISYIVNNPTYAVGIGLTGKECVEYVNKLPDKKYTVVVYKEDDEIPINKWENLNRDIVLDIAYVVDGREELIENINKPVIFS